jgi:hypothetical protein
MTCASCGRVIAETPAPGTPCPTCGTELSPDAPLEVDPAWVASRAAGIAAATAPPPKPRGRGGMFVVAIALLVMVGVFVVMLMQRQPSAQGTELPDGIELTIQAPRPTTFTIDGVKSGKTPMSIRLKGGNRIMRIEGGGVIKEVRADRDQVVNLVK